MCAAWRWLPLPCAAAGWPIRPARWSPFAVLQTLTMLVRREPFPSGEIGVLRQLWQDMSYDAVYFPGMSAGDANRFVVVPDARTTRSSLPSWLVRRFLSSLSISQPAPMTAPSSSMFSVGARRPAIVRNLGKVWQPFAGPVFWCW